MFTRTNKALLLFLGIITAICMLLPTKLSERELRTKVVKLYKPGVAMCSGTQIKAPSGISYILSAGHCAKLADNDGQILVQDEHGHQLKRRVIQEDPNSDLLLIEGLPGVDGIDIAQDWHPGQHVRTFTHGGNMPTYKTEGELIGIEQIQVILDQALSPDVLKDPCNMPKETQLDIPVWLFKDSVVHACILDVSEVVSTARIIPGSSGGMVVDDDGKLVGVASAGGEQWNFFVKPSDIVKFINNY